MLALYNNRTDFIHSDETLKNETWQACVTPNDGIVDGSTACSNVVTLRNAIPAAPFQIFPADNSSTFLRFPNFTWFNATDADGDNLTYRVEVANSATFSTASVVINTTVTGRVGINVTNYTDFNPLEVDTEYFWRISSTDGFTNGTFSNTTNFTIPSLLSLSLPIDLVSFGNVTQDSVVNTTNASTVAPFVLRNDGNIGANVTIISTRLFLQGAFPSTAYQYFVEENETGSFNLSNSSIFPWRNFTNITGTRVDIKALDWNDTQDAVNIHVMIAPPNDEPQGNRSANVTMSAE